jgi:excisionase family DNA binding protein
MSAETLARQLECSVRTIRRLSSSGKLPAPVHIGGRCVRWLSAEILAWLAAGAPDRKTWGTMKRSLAGGQ